MSSSLESSSPVPAAEAVDATADRPRPALRPTTQVGLSTLLLATACFAVWWSYLANRREFARLEARLAATRPLARELFLTGRNRLAVIKQHETRYDEQVWHIFVPDDSLALHLATRDIPAQSSKWIDPETTPVKTAPLRQGTHIVELRSQLHENQWTTEVMLDRETVISVVEPKDWNAGSGWSGGGGYEQQTEFPPGTRAVLLERLFLLPGRGSQRLPQDRGNGILLWIE